MTETAASPPDATVPVLEARGIGRRGGERWLLSELSLSLRRGERLALVGPSGSGKTLLLRSLVLLDPLDAGEVLFRGNPVRGNGVPRVRSRVVYLPQRPAMGDGTVEEYLRFPYELAAHRERSFDRQRVVERLETLGRDASFLEKQQRDLSGGETQLAALLRVVQLGPEVLLLDEPTAALDAAATRQVESLVSAWYDGKPDEHALIWVSHDAEQARRVATRTLRLDQGRLVES